MLRVLNCVRYEHDLRLVTLSAIICALGCCTTTTLMFRAQEGNRKYPFGWLMAAALLFGASVWSLHFVAMLAFIPDMMWAYDLQLTGLSLAIACGGAMAGLALWQAPMPQPFRIIIGGSLLSFAVSGMHYVGVAATSFSGYFLFQRQYVTASLCISVICSIMALWRASDLASLARRVEVGGWLALAICGLHFTGMAAITVAPGMATETNGTVLGSAALALAVGGASLAILLAALAAILIEQFLSRRMVQDLGRLRLMSNLAQEVVLIQRDGIVLEVNSAGERMFETSAEELIGRSLLSLFVEDSVPALLRRDRCPPLGRPPEEFCAQTTSGLKVSVEMTCQPIDYRGQTATAIALRDLTDRKRDEARIRHLARHDALTNLPNRYNLQERLDVALDSASQQGGSLVVVYIDLDRFKPVNDLFGHAVGDILLMQVAKRISSGLHSTDTLARIGGDEFVLMSTNEPQPEKVSQLASRIIEELRQPFEIESYRIEVGASIGIALYPGDGTTAEELMRAADMAMYRAKEDGRGALRFFEPLMNTQLQARLQLEQELAGAADRGELLLHYQPMVNGVTGDVETFEALIRWQHPQKGLVSPFAFIPLAEETGLIDQIGRWVIETACREAALWPYPWRVSINVSPRQFRQSDLSAVIANAMQTNGLSPSRVVVEVTEGVLIHDAAQAVATLKQLRALGIRIALDDFGTGYSSLNYLQMFKFDKLKIDKSFIMKLGQSDDALTITHTIVNLGHNLGLHVTAEGVETPEQLAILQSLGCDQIQGFLVGKPAPVAAFNDIERARASALFRRELCRLAS